MTPGEEPDAPVDGDRQPIGVGMGGSCPECRSPVALGQQYCLECGAPIRPKARKGAAGATGSSPPPKGFPWAPFIGVLLLLVVGVTFVLLNSTDGGERRSGTDDTSTIPELTDEVPDDTDLETVQTETTSTDDCIEEGEFPTGSDGGELPDDGLGEEEFPIDDGSGLPPEEEFPDATEGFPGEEELGLPVEAADLAMDEQGADDSGNPSGFPTVVDDPLPQPPGTPPPSPLPGDPAPTADGEPFDPCLEDPTATSATTPTTPTTPTTSTTGGDAATGAEADEWPTGFSGFTVVIAALPHDTYDRPDADQRAVEAEQRGITAGVLDSSQFPSLKQGYWVVFAGVFETENEASSHLGSVSGTYPGAYVREVSTTP